MAETRIPYDRRSTAYQREVVEIQQLLIPSSRRTELLHLLAHCARHAHHLPNGYIKKIVWDAAGGYPESGWGYLQYSPRPYQQGFGCDGTTNLNIHLLAATFCQRLGLDYLTVYLEAYPDRPRSSTTLDWLTTLTKNSALQAETCVPADTTTDHLMLVLSDLYQINNRSVVSVLEEAFTAHGFAVDTWWTHEDRLRNGRHL